MNSFRRAATTCAEPIARILKPLRLGSFYKDLDAKAIIAKEWKEDSSGFSFVAELGSLGTSSGIYTVKVWRAGEGTRLKEGVLELAAVQR